MVVGILNYNAGNIYNIKKTLLSLKVKVRVIKSKKDFKGCDKLVLPGVGSFETAMMFINKNKMKKDILEFISKNKTILAICLGMQILFEKSEECKKINGLSILKGNVEKIRFKKNSKCKIPNINYLLVRKKGKNKNFFEQVKNNKFYFSHSYICLPKKIKSFLKTKYCNKNFISGILYKKIIGVQFHPELSGTKGVELFKNFLKY